jgi:hypothetical protein
MKIVSEIKEQRSRWIANYGMEPDCVYIGAKQSKEIDELVAMLTELGLFSTCDPVPRAKLDSLWIYRVDAENHLSFGLEPMSPCS